MAVVMAASIADWPAGPGSGGQMAGAASAGLATSAALCSPRRSARLRDIVLARKDVPLNVMACSPAFDAKKNHSCSRQRGEAAKWAPHFCSARRHPLERRHAFGDDMEGLLVDGEDRHLRRAKEARVVERSDLQDHERQVEAPGGQMRPAIGAELARHRRLEIAAGESLGRAAHVAEALRPHQHEHIRRAAADILAFAAMALRLEPRLALGDVAHALAIASAFETQSPSSYGPPPTLTAPAREETKFCHHLRRLKPALPPLTRQRDKIMGEVRAPCRFAVSIP